MGVSCTSQQPTPPPKTSPAAQGEREGNKGGREADGPETHAQEASTRYRQGKMICRVASGVALSSARYLDFKHGPVGATNRHVVKSGAIRSRAKHWGPEKNNVRDVDAKKPKHAGPDPAAANKSERNTPVTRPPRVRTRLPGLVPI